MSDRTAHEQEKIEDPPDFADSYALLDKGQVLCEVEPIDPHRAEGFDYIRSTMRARRVDSHLLIEGDR